MAICLGEWGCLGDRWTTVVILPMLGARLLRKTITLKPVCHSTSSRIIITVGARLSDAKRILRSSPVGLNQFLHQLGSSMPITNLDSCLFQPTQWCWLESSILTYDQSILSHIWLLQHPSSQEVIRYILPVSEGLVNSLGYCCNPTDSWPHSNHHRFR